VSTIAVGDIHGNAKALDDLLCRLEARLTAGDSVGFLGDYIDRGPDSCGCIERLLGFRAATPATVVTLMGNHEDWLLRSLEDPTRHSWILGMEAFPTIASYSVDAARRLRAAIEELGPRVVTERNRLRYDLFSSVLPDEHLRFLRELKLFHRDGDTVFVHGGLDPSRGPVEAQDRQPLLWGTDAFPGAYDGSDLVVYGHRDDAVLDDRGWPQPRFSDSTIGVDSISHGVLTAIALPGRRILQSARHET